MARLGDNNPPPDPVARPPDLPTLAAMRDELTNDVAAGVATYRRAAGLTQAELAARIDRSVSWVSAVEQGRRHAERLTDVMAIAAALRCRVEDLTRRPVDPLTTPGVRPGGLGMNPDLDAVRTVILRSPVPPPPGGPAEDIDPADVQERVDQTWAVWHGSPTGLSQVGAVLPTLLDDALACHRQASAPGRRPAARALSGAWQLAGRWAHHLTEQQLAGVAAERALSAAGEADDPHLIALGHWAVAESYGRIGEHAEATRLCLSADDVIGPLLSRPDPSPGLLAAHGMLHLSAAMSAAICEGDDRAWALHRVAEQAAAAMGGRYDPWTVFGVGTVDFWAVAIQVALGHPDAVVDHAARLDLDAVPSNHRRAVVRINVAAGLGRRGQDQAAARMLLEAEQVATDKVRTAPQVRELLRELLRRDRASARPHTLGLARRVGLVAA
jgi:DNA-binding XRE family transcriptional regulator